jgi:hypothetical protein
MRVISWEVMLEQPTLILTKAVRRDGWMLSRGINRPRTVSVALFRDQAGWVTEKLFVKI